METTPTKTTLRQGFCPAPSRASPEGRSDSRPIAKATRETPRRSERPSLKVVSSAPAATTATPKPLLTATIVSSKGEEDCERRDAPSTASTVVATSR